jgi:Kdo2-lipid IVA 3' secondary acyltransferase
MSKIIKSIKNSLVLRKMIEVVFYLLLRLLFATYRLRIEYEPGITKPFNGVLFSWHQNIISLAAFFFENNRGCYCVVSSSKDGQFVGSITQRLGLNVLYGSAHKGPTSLVRNALSVLEKERQIFLIGDGSRGPAKKLQPGVRYLAHKTGLPIIFIDFEVKGKIILKKTWDKFQIPLPFSKILVTVKRAKCTYR